MSVSISIKIPELGATRAKLNASPIKASVELNRAIRDSAFVVQGNAKQELGSDKGGWDTGRLANSIIPQFGVLRAEIAPRVEYAIFVHQGTRPHWAPLAALAPWARRHGLEAKIVQRSIAFKGTKANPFMARAVEASEKPITKIFLDAFERILKL